MTLAVKLCANAIGMPDVAPMRLRCMGATLLLHAGFPVYSNMAVTELYIFSNLYFKKKIKYVIIVSDPSKKIGVHARFVSLLENIHSRKERNPVLDSMK